VLYYNERNCIGPVQFGPPGTSQIYTIMTVGLNNDANVVQLRLNEKTDLADYMR